LKAFLCSALALQKNVTAFASRKLLPQMPIGVERPRNVGEKGIGGGSCGGNTFFIAVACALAGTSGTERGENAHHLHKTFYRSPCALACGGSSGYFT
jgi:hypothetical protein